MSEKDISMGSEDSKQGLFSVFSWVLPALKNRRTLKTWIRCCIVLAVTLILMMDDKTLKSMGQAGFFAAIVAIMLPPYMALSVFIFAAFTLLLGMLIGWAWGSAAMAAGLSVRSQALLAQQQQKAHASMVPGISASFQQQSFIFHGLFLDPRSSAVYGAFLFIGTFALGALRAYIPKLGLLSIFGSIVLDIMCCYGPSFPVSQYTLAKQFLIPTTYYVAVAIASLIFIFPESVNHVWLTSLRSGFLQPTLELLSIQSQALASRPSDRRTWTALTVKGDGYRRGIAAGMQALLGQLSMVDLEVSIGTLGPGDLKKVSSELKSLMFRSVGLHSFLTFVNDVNAVDEKEEDRVDKILKRGDSTPRTADRYMNRMREIREREVQHGHDLDSLVPILAEASAGLRTACDAGFRGVTDWFQECNSARWAGFFSKLNNEKVAERHAKLETCLKELGDKLEEFRKFKRVKLVKPFERFFDPSTGRILDEIMHKKTDEMFAARSLFICFVFVDTLDAFAERLVSVLRSVVSLDSRRPKPRLWTPSGFGKLWRKVMSHADIDDNVAPIQMGTSSDPTAFESNGSSHSMLADGDDSDDEEEEEEAKSAKPKNPDALPPTTSFGKFFLHLGGFFRFLKSAEGIFALRLGVVSVALWIPSVCVSTAWFYYENKGIWALIMAQTGLAMYAGDQIAQFIVRLGGTILGLLFGMAAWYIGAGHGGGNPYGMVIATTVIVAPFILGRLAAPPGQMMVWIMSGVTIVFIVGYSWINTHLPVLASPGVGVTLGWKRALLVVIGFTAAFVVMMFPRPNSSRTLVRRTLAATMGGISQIFAEEIEAFLAEEARARGGHHEKVDFKGEGSGDEDSISPKEKRVRKLSRKFLAISNRLQGLAPSLATSRFEPQLQGTWPHEQYQALYKIQTKLLLSLVVLISAFTKLDTRWCSILVHRTPFLNPSLLSDIFSHIAILSAALSGAHPLPPAMPILRDRLIYHENHSNHGKYAQLVAPISKVALEKPGADTDSEIEGEGSGADFVAGRIDGSSIGFEELSLDVLLDDQLPAHSTAVVALSNVITLVDEMTNIVRNLCGETTFRGFDTLQRDYLGREEKALGSGYAAKVQ